MPAREARRANFWVCFVLNTKEMLRKSGARSAPGEFWAYFVKNTKEMLMNPGARSAPGEILGVLYLNY